MTIAEALPTSSSPLAELRALRAADAARDDAQTRYWITCEVIAEQAVKLGEAPGATDRARLTEAREALDVADREAKQAREAWFDTRAMPPAEARRLTVEIAVAAAEAAVLAEKAVQA